MVLRVLLAANPLKKLTVRFLSSQRSYEEIKIPVPWGHVSAKWWKPLDTRPLLAVHGIQENAGSFDELVPHLPEDIGIMAIDYPGHGFSSQLPAGCFYHRSDAVTLYRWIIKYFNWDKVSLLGHSLGAITNTAYTMVFPKNVDVLICLDGLVLVSKTRTKLAGIAKTVDTFLKHDALNSSGDEQICCTLEELKQKLHVGSRNSLNFDRTETILRRSCFPVENKPGMYRLVKDFRLRSDALVEWPLSTWLEGAARIECPVFFSIGTSSFYASQKNHLAPVLEEIRKHNQRFCFCEVEGTHHAHLNNPERLAHPLNDFLLKYYRNTP